jgi:hypothetical protein
LFYHKDKALSKGCIKNRNLISKLNNAFNKNIFITIPTGGFENFGINNFRKFVKDIKNG